MICVLDDAHRILQINQAIANLPAPNEDCLSLNVWSPATRAAHTTSTPERT